MSLREIIEAMATVVLIVVILMLLDIYPRFGIGLGVATGQILGQYQQRRRDRDDQS